MDIKLMAGQIYFVKELNLDKDINYKKEFEKKKEQSERDHLRELEYRIILAMSMKNIQLAENRKS